MPNENEAMPSQSEQETPKKKGFLAERIPAETHKKTNKNGYIVLGVFGGVIALALGVSIVGVYASNIAKRQNGKTYLSWTSAAPGFYDQNKNRILNDDGTMAGSFSLKEEKDSDGASFYAVDSIETPAVAARYLVMPSSYGGTSILQIASAAQNENIFAKDASFRYLAGLYFQGYYATIGDYSFQGLPSLQTLSFGNAEGKFQTLGTASFYGTTSLSEVSFSKCLRSIGASCFEGTKSLAKADLSKTALRTIGERAFAKSGLKDLYLPKSLAKIEDEAFAEVSGLSVAYEGTSLDWDKMIVSASSFEKGTNVFFSDGSVRTL